MAKKKTFAVGDCFDHKVAQEYGKLVMIDGETMQLQTIAVIPGSKVEFRYETCHVLWLRDMWQPLKKDEFERAINEAATYIQYGRIPARGTMKKV